MVSQRFAKPYRESGLWVRSPPPPHFDKLSALRQNLLIKLSKGTGGWRSLRWVKW